METFKALLQELDATLRQYNMPAYENLLPPLPDAEIDKNLRELGIDDEDMRALFQWKGGRKSHHGAMIMEYGSLWTFETIKEQVSFNQWYDSNLVPLIAEGWEQILLFNIKRGPHYGKLYLFSVPQLYIDHPISYYDSLSAMVMTTISAYRRGIYYYDNESKSFDYDSRGFDTMAKENNKHCAFWTDHDEVRPEEWYEI